LYAANPEGVRQFARLFGVAARRQQHCIEEPIVAARKKKSLVIVESPAKAKTINKYLGTDFEVTASKGHVRDLPKSRFGIDIDAGWVPSYRPLKDRKDVLTALKKMVGSAGTVYLAPDPDREGEAIAWHLKEALGLKEERTRRVRFNEITKTAVQKAFTEAGDIDMDLVAAQEARRFLDRVVGYNLSPLLSRKLAQHLSAGRVQSVAVRLIVEREREIQAFKPEEYWKITAILATEGLKKKVKQGDLPPAPATLAKDRPKPGKKPVDKPGEDGAAEETEKEKEEKVKALPAGAFVAELNEWNGKKFEASSQEVVDPIVAALQKAPYAVAKIEQKERMDRPSAPFTTSTLQQQASIRLHYSAKRTMMIAQRLYEGVDLPKEGSVALITYMRTDSTRISEDALKTCREHIQKKYGKPYLPEKANRYAAGKGAQEAHEAIRPTDLSYTPDKLKDILPHDLLRLYTLIYNRFVASQMTPAVFAVTTVDIAADKGMFRASGRIMKFDGYRRVLPPGKQEDTLLPALAEKQKLDLLRLNHTQHFTEPPPRYSEASLVKTLEKEGIGRPSTYASIISKIQDEKRGYVEQRDRRFYAKEMGMKVTDLLVEHFPKVMDLQFTRHMEEELDQIESRKTERNAVLTEFWEPFDQALKQAETKMQTDEEKCPECGKPLVERFSKFGKFFGCSGHPECKYIKRNNERASREPPKPTEHACPNCGKPMVQRMGRRGPFLGCSGYPECKTTMNIDNEGKPVLSSRPTEHKCEKCGADMVLREGPARPLPLLLRLSQVPQRHGCRCQRQSGQADSGRHRLREVRRTDGCEARPARTIPRLQRLSEVPQHEEDPRGNEGKDQRDAAPRAAQEGNAEGRDHGHLPRLRQSDENPLLPRQLLPRLLQVPQVQGNPRGIAGVA
jgi:DNA topoisomerase-1